MAVEAVIDVVDRRSIYLAVVANWRRFDGDQYF